MTGAAVQFSIDGLDQALATLSAAAALGADPLPVYDQIGAAMVTSTEMRFENQAGPDGSPWPPSIRALVEGGLTLQKTGALAQSITHQADAQGVEWGTNLVYAAPNQFGATIRPVSASKLRFRLPGNLGWRSADEVTIPARPFLGVDAEDETEILEILAEAARGVGFEGEA